jgi:hypothetical protein
MSSCTSSALVQVFHNLVVKSKLRAFDSEYLQMAYDTVTGKIVHFVMTKGWKELLLRIKDCRSPVNNNQYSSDIYR